MRNFVKIEKLNLVIGRTIQINFIPGKIRKPAVFFAALDFFAILCFSRDMNLKSHLTTVELGQTFLYVIFQAVYHFFFMRLRCIIIFLATTIFFTVSKWCLHSRAFLCIGPCALTLASNASNQPLCNLKQGLQAYY